ncbi:Fur family transcriptional regulator [Lentzea sp. E54]|uniref:Fur family transcriptional regulator n=1 Tax=Lentzea xerophila TaxID=3435883 RepID=UPI003DA52487
MDQDLPRRHTEFVLTALGPDGAFVTAHELHRRVNSLGHPMAISTAYRVLKDLVKRRVVHVIVEEHGQRRYRRCSPRPHHHLVCSTCHATVEIEAHSSSLPAWAPVEASGFTDVFVRVTITGICAQCAQTPSSCG